MILVHRLRGEPMYLNPDLVESIEETPDTVLTLVDGRRTVVSDAADVIVERILRYRSSVIAAAEDMRTGAGLRRTARPTDIGSAEGADTQLRVVPGGDD